MRLSVPRPPAGRRDHRDGSRPARRRRISTALVGAAAAAACLPVAALTGVTGAAAAPAVGTPSADAPVRHHYAADHMGSGLAARTSLGARTAATARATARSVGGVLGMDVSGWQKDVDWPAAYAAGARFAVVKATEGTTYTNAYFAQQYDGSASVGMIRGAYHFALPNSTPGSGTAQADFFVDHGGGWSADGLTLPPALDIEYNPYGPTCYRLTPAAMVSWIQDFVTEVHARTDRYPLIYSTLGWWTRCTGNSAAFSLDPLWIADYGSDAGIMPAGWSFPTVWQYADSGAFPGDQDSFNGSADRLETLAISAEDSSGQPIVDTVRAVLPSHVIVGSAVTAIPVTVTTGEPQLEVTVALRSASGRTSATATLTSTTPTTQFSGSVVLRMRSLAGWGPQKWVITTPDPTATQTLGAVVRAESILGLRAKRTGTTVTIVSGARAYKGSTGRFEPWANHPVVVQRWTSRGWIQVTATRTDSRGNVHLTLHIPFTVGLRLVDPSTSNIWGGTSVPATL